MGKCIPQIKLSSGRILNIPVFSYHTGPETETQFGGILKIYKEENGVRSQVASTFTLNDNDLMELFTLLLGKKILGIRDYTSSAYGDGRGITTTLSYSTWLIYWYENSQGEYKLRFAKPFHNTYVSQQYIEKCTAVPSFQDGFARSSESSVLGNGSSYAYRAYNGNGVRWYDHNTFDPIMTIDTYEGMKTYVEEHYTGSNSRTHCINIDAATGSLTATYIENDVSEETTAISGWAQPDMAFDVVYEALTTNAETFDLDIGINVYDNEDPYSYEPATFGGGDGSMGRFNPDGVDPAQIPSLPQLSASDIGFMSIYNPSTAQLKSLSAFLWSNAFDIDSFKKLFSDPMECIIGLAVVPVQPTIGGTKNVTFGDIDSGVGMSYLATEYVEKNMGSVSIDLLYGSFMDYQTSIQIYLPYIGFRQLQPDDIIGGSISVTYHINVLDGGCTAYISHSTRGVLYQYSGSCIANVPLSAINYSGAIQNAVSAAINGAAVVAGVATGAAPVSIMGAAGLASNAANLAMNSKPQVQRSGTVSGSAGLMGVQRPYIIIERPNISIPNGRHTFVGNTTNVTMPLFSCSGFTMVDEIHLDGVPCTENERDELYQILKKGVIL